VYVISSIFYLNTFVLPGTGGLGEFSLKQRASFCRDTLILSITTLMCYFIIYA